MMKNVSTLGHTYIHSYIQADISQQSLVTAPQPLSIPLGMNCSSCYYHLTSRTVPASIL